MNVKATNVLTQELIDNNHGVFVVNQNYTLGGRTILLPNNYILLFKSGGYIDIGVLQGTDSQIVASSGQCCFGSNLKISGTWNVPDIHDTWFKYETDKSSANHSNLLLKNLFALANDKVQNTIHTTKSRRYEVEIPFEGKGDFGNQISFKMVNGKKRKDFLEIYEEKFSFLQVFTIPSNTKLLLDCQIILRPTNLGAYFLFWEKDKENITIEGSGGIRGDLTTHLYNNPFTPPGYFGEWGHLLTFIRCHNITLRGITVSDAWGDCIGFHGSFLKNDQSPRWASGLTMKDVKVKRARRNGVTIAARNCRISNCHFEGCGMINATWPKAAIDFEADGLERFAELGNENVVMENCTFKNNFRDIAASNNNLPAYGRTATTIRNCTFPNPIRIVWGNWLRFENCTISSFIGAWSNPIDSKNTIKHTEFVNCIIKNLPEIMRTTSWNNKFERCTIVQTTK